jgi:Protein of unknown function (DUF2782)
MRIAPNFHALALLSALGFAFALNAFAQKTPPPNLEAVPEPPPPAPEIANDPDLEPQITVVHKDKETVEEYRVNGRLTMLKVTPKGGKPYYLVANGPDGTLIRRDSLDSGLRVPMWLLFSF